MRMQAENEQDMKTKRHRFGKRLGLKMELPQMNRTASSNSQQSGDKPIRKRLHANNCATKAFGQDFRQNTECAKRLSLKR